MDKNIIGSTNTISLDVSSLSDGAYIIVLRGEQVSETKRFVILQ